MLMTERPHSPRRSFATASGCMNAKKLRTKYAEQHPEAMTERCLGIAESSRRRRRAASLLGHPSHRNPVTFSEGLPASAASRAVTSS